VILSGTTYATANLTSVAKRFTPASKGCAMLLTVLVSDLRRARCGGRRVAAVPEADVFDQCGDHTAGL